MNPADLPRELTCVPPPETDALLAAVRAVAQGPLKQQVEAIDRQGQYPRAVLQELAKLGAMSAHLDTPAGAGSYALAIQAMAEVSRVCGATGFMMWCQAVCGLYMQQSGNPALMGEVLLRHASGAGLGGTALSNPMKSYAQIESLLLKATPVDGGYLVNGTLPWVSNLGPDHYFGAIAAVMAGDAPAAATGSGACASREVMFLLRCDAPGVELRECPSFSAMEGTGTYGVRLKDHFIGTNEIMADPAKPYIARIRAAFVMLQCGMAVGITQGAIDSMWAVESQLGHVNQFLEDRPDTLQAELDALTGRVIQLAETPFEPSAEFFIDVLDARAHGAELCLRAAQSALMHQGARGYLMSSEVQRRVRESHFVAIVTPAIKHLRKEIARLSAEEQPE
ncbi:MULTISPECIES: acyl-CoA dehydrogenase family protein [unclassified Polaromonas]|jgi:alkylation response protein AidB-like acyl-CoA dehydrogenase|uniref:acyl-CoA dehydrogenase family protein n=1 Tax=unclassified Polaromonas TaxID=2638319 RepID=UPI000BDB6552|nr:MULTISPECIES: acyl-CoA dehydrogenase family protein [unclassified Polaromonas]OYY31975.1 MAG: acyl-CoA dehydrogenase [Polaromonas sp. 35-63-35]OYZ13543.1 MAG: acyl-CoA dehydrogenase [Polaromonas sp. 16-63-31]OYZ75377.1 MAG: acyl-CoA dehydrogenase [Polaromonas sp. 24-63-21]OZA45521.1 MAG: acyl-CoA dehydrogenase [Polaromonas sp. 17-63-33]OZA85006.1 MAG: acyl-CoA dehydrogenase [Polaromonas sp. 39-63-25]